MKIICKQENLIKALNIVSKAISVTSPLGITRGILIKTEGDMSASLSATDIQIAITTKTDCIVNEYGGVVVSAKLFIDLVRKLPPGEITIKTAENNVVSVTTDISDYELQGLKEEEFPRIESGDEGKKLKIDKDIFRSMIEGTAFATSIDESRGVLTGVLVEIEEEDVTMVALDGYRVAIRREYIPGLSGTARVIVPGRLLREAGKIIGEEETEETGIVAEITPRKMKMWIGNTVVSMSLLEGEYIKYREVIPSESRIRVNVSRRDLLQSIERASMLKSDGKNAFLRFSIEGNELTISSRADDAKGKETVHVVKEGEDIEIGFDARFMAEALKAVPDDTVEIIYNTSVSPSLIKPLSGEKYEYLVLPVRLSTVNV
jgi:DNA polymerase-3 subunit beta